MFNQLYLINLELIIFFNINLSDNDFSQYFLYQKSHDFKIINMQFHNKCLIKVIFSTRDFTEIGTADIFRK